MTRALARNVAAALATAALLFPGTLQAKAPKPPQPIVVKIDDVPWGPPVVTVTRAPHGYSVYRGPEVANPDIEDGGIITLFGVDPFGSINPGDHGWRFVDPSLPADTYRNATDIVWIQHDWSGTGALKVGFNTVEADIRYINPDYMGDDSAGPATNNWVTVYSDKTIEVQFRSRNP